jgi:hypothetical protein
MVISRPALLTQEAPLLRELVVLEHLQVAATAAAAAAAEMVPIM